MANEIHGRRRNADGNNPPIKGGGKRKNRDRRKEQRRDEALIRQAAWDDMTAAERLAVLVARGQGFTVEATRLRHKGEA